MSRYGSLININPSDENIWEKNGGFFRRMKCKMWQHKKWTHFFIRGNTSSSNLPLGEKWENSIFTFDLAQLQWVARKKEFWVLHIFLHCYLSLRCPADFNIIASILNGLRDIDPRGWPIITAGGDHNFHTCCPSSVHPSVCSHFSKSRKTKRISSDCYWRDCGSGWVAHWWHLDCELLFLTWGKNR